MGDDAPRLSATYSVELLDHGPEPEWHTDRRYYSAAWGRVELVVRDSGGGELGRAKGTDERDAWHRLASVMGARLDAAMEELRRRTAQGGSDG